MQRALIPDPAFVPTNASISGKPFAGRMVEDLADREQGEKKRVAPAIAGTTLHLLNTKSFPK